MKPVPHGEPYAGKLHVRFDEGAGVSDNKGRSALLYTLLSPGQGQDESGAYCAEVPAFPKLPPRQILLGAPLVIRESTQRVWALKSGAKPLERQSRSSKGPAREKVVKTSYTK